MLKHGKVIFLPCTHKMTNISIPLHVSVKTGIPARGNACLISFFKVRMTESISDMHEHICTGLAPSGQTSIFLHHRQWPEARRHLRDLPRATSRSVRSLLEETVHHQSPGKDQWSHQAPHSSFLRELTNKCLFL